MCNEICVMKDGVLHGCETIRELRKFVGRPVQIDYGNGTPPYTFSDDECLCNVDVEATAKKVGAKARRATEREGWPFTTSVIVISGKPKARAASPSGDGDRDS